VKNNQPIRCFDGNAQPYQPFWTFRNAAETESGETELELYGPISEFLWFGDEVTPRMFKDQLYSTGKGAAVTVRLNSPGGDLIAASVMSAILKDYPGKVTVKVDGLAASAAVMVALAGDRVLIQPSAYMMIHDPAVGIMGYFKVDDLKGLIDELKSI
jgi:ATP-dependent Clp protease protease subunit